MKSLAIWLILLSLSASCQEQGMHADVNILFVGNSLTYSNNLPAMVEALGNNDQIVIRTKMLAYANYALEDHWNDGEMQRLIATEKYDYVIVQQGPSSQMDGRAMLLDYGTRIKALCDKHRTKLGFYMVWPSRGNSWTFDAVIDNYTHAAHHTQSLLCPVGLVWKQHFDETGDYSYYGPDEFHPSLAGSLVAASVIYNSIRLGVEE